MQNSCWLPCKKYYHVGGGVGGFRGRHAQAVMLIHLYKDLYKHLYKDVSVWSLSVSALFVRGRAEGRLGTSLCSNERLVAQLLASTVTTDSQYL